MIQFPDPLGFVEKYFLQLDLFCMVFSLLRFSDASIRVPGAGQGAALPDTVASVSGGGVPSVAVAAIFGDAIPSVSVAAISGDAVPSVAVVTISGDVVPSVDSSRVASGYGDSSDSVGAELDIPLVAASSLPVPSSAIEGSDALPFTDRASHGGEKVRPFHPSRKKGQELKRLSCPSCELDPSQRFTKFLLDFTVTFEILTVSRASKRGNYIGILCI